MTAGALLMTYGSPRSLDEVGPYLRDIRGGRPIREGAIEELTERYAKIGGSSPLLEITRRQAQALQRELGTDARVFIGMKHWHPYIRDAVAEAAEAGVTRLVGVALAPHYARMSIGGYEQRVRDAIDSVGAPIDFRMVQSWYDEPSFVELVVRNIEAALSGWPLDGTAVFFTAHSLPERILEEGDPYRDQLLESAKLVAAAAQLAEHELAFQSASSGGEPWLGPDILDALEAAAGRGAKRALIVPIGFTADHLEILHDIDIECVAKARSLDLEVRRTRLPNDDPALVAALASVVRRTLA